MVSLLAEQRKKITSGGALCAKTVLHALLEARGASLEVIDAIQRWRLTLVRPEVFNVCGKNYAVVMATDMGFLATGLSTLKEKFGMEFGTGNPFALPCAPSSSIAAARGSGNTVAASKGKTCGEPHKLASPNRVPAKTKGNDTPECLSVVSGSTSFALESMPKEDGGRGGISIGGVTGDGEAGSKPGFGAAPESGDTSTINGRNFVNDINAVVAATEEAVAAGEDQDGEVRGRVESIEEHEQKRRPPEKMGNEGERDGDGAFVRDMLLKLGTVDGAQRARLAKAQRFLEQEIARRV